MFAIPDQAIAATQNESVPEILELVKEISDTRPDLVAAPISSIETSESTAVSQTALGAEVTVPQDPSEPIRMTGQADFDFEVRLSNATGLSNGVRDDNGLVAYADELSLGTAVVPTSVGFQVLTSIDDRDSPSEFTYEMNVPKNASLVDMGDCLHIETADQTYVALSYPWAQDASGTPVPTTYELAEGVLIQRVDISQVSSFPVVVDPSWSYVLTYNTNKSPTDVVNMLQTCFNCYFPISGAPKLYPRVGDVLPLYIPLLPPIAGIELLAINAPVTVTTWNYRVQGNAVFTFAFQANAGHFDGEDQP